MRATTIIVLALSMLAGCGPAPAPGRVDESGTDAPADPGTPCPECGGSGLSPRTGDARPCLLCDGDGVCPICREDEEGECVACGGDRRCPDCGGDGRLSRARGDIGPTGAPFPGQCPVCEHGQGVCPGCRGATVVPACALCAGAGTCPACRGHGTDPWCGGTGFCPTCAGRGRFVGAIAARDWPPFRVILGDGEVIQARLLRAPDRYFAWEREADGRTIREAVLARDVDPVSVILARRRYATTAADHLEIARYALARGKEFLYVARAEIRRADALAPTIRAEDLAIRIENEWREFIAAQTGAAAAPVADEGGIRARRLEAEAARHLRDVRRAILWRSRAEDILARTGVGLPSIQRALRAAEESWLDGARAANLAPEGIDRTAALTEVSRGRHLRTRCIVAAADRLLAAGHPERARALAMLALIVEPEDDGARRFIAVVEEALARHRTAEDTK